MIPLGSRLLVLALWLGGATACVKAPSEATALAPSAPAGPTAVTSLLEHARGFEAAGDHLRAEQYLNAALLQGAEERTVLPLLVRACVTDQRFRDAAQYLEDHLRRHPSDAGARLLLGSLLHSLGQAEPARRQLALVVAADPNRAEAQYALALVLRDDLGDVAEADRHFREYLRLRPLGEHAEEARGSLLSDVP
jgi:tetratricopeptide (TPR) repeat protein